MSVGKVPLGVALIQIAGWIRIASSCFVSSEISLSRHKEIDSIVYHKNFDFNLFKVTSYYLFEHRKRTTALLSRRCMCVCECVYVSLSLFHIIVALLSR